MDCAVAFKDDFLDVILDDVLNKTFYGALPYVEPNIYAPVLQNVLTWEKRVTSPPLSPQGSTSPT